MVLGPHDDAAATARVGAQHPRSAHDDAAGREVGALDDLAQLGDGRRRVVQDGADGRRDFAQVVGRQARRHADRDAVRAVAQQVRKARGQDGRLHEPLVVVGLVVDRLLVEIRHHLDGRTVHARLGVTHGRGRVAVDRAEVPLSVDQRVAQREALRHAHQRGIDDRFAVRVVLTRGVACDVGALTVLRRGPQLEVVHRDQDPALGRLQAVAHIRKGPRVDDAERVVEVRLAHLALDQARLDQAARGRRIGALGGGRLGVTHGRKSAESIEGEPPPSGAGGAGPGTVASSIPIPHYPPFRGRNPPRI